MNPKLKAQELTLNFYTEECDDVGNHMNYECAKQCALICADEILKSNPLKGMYGLDRDYYEQVKQEINKL